MPLYPGQILKDRYELVGLLGQGGMGSVYRALDTLSVPPTAIALKVRTLADLPEDPSQAQAGLDKTNLRNRNSSSVYTRSRAAEQFKTEARLLHNFHHPNLPRVTDYFADGDDLYLVMELIEGKNLDQILSANGDRPLSEPDVLNWLGLVMDALVYCHSQNIFHRDIKPSNIIINQSGKAYLVDFGIARFSSEGSVTTILGGSPGFSPLEQMSRRGKVDARSDIYALGATFYLLLTGQVPEEAIDRAQYDSLVPPRQFNPLISDRMEKTILCAMQMKQEDRFSSVEEMQVALGMKPSVNESLFFTPKLESPSVKLAEPPPPLIHVTPPNPLVSESQSHVSQKTDFKSLGLGCLLGFLTFFGLTCLGFAVFGVISSSSSDRQGIVSNIGMGTLFFVSAIGLVLGGIVFLRRTCQVVSIKGIFHLPDVVIRSNHSVRGIPNKWLVRFIVGLLTCILVYLLSLFLYAMLMNVSTDFTIVIILLGFVLGPVLGWLVAKRTLIS